jgi:hypothetical protein
MLSFTLWRAFTTPVTYALLVVLIGTAVMQVKYVNNALQRFDSTQVIPVQFVMFTLSVIIGSAILYRDFEKATTDNILKFVGGCLLTFFGVYLITSGRSRIDPNEDDEILDEEQEERISLTERDRLRDTVPYTDTVPKQPSTTRIVPRGRGDLAHDKDGEDSRRSSRVSFAEPSPLSRSSRVYSNSPYQTSPHITTLPSPSAQSTRTEETPLLDNPWTESADTNASTRPLGIHGTSSSPSLPTQTELPPVDPTKPSTPKDSVDAAVRPRLTPHQTAVPLQADRSSTPGRNSISRIMPGQLISPLSGGLSVVVADSLRRGVDSPLRNKSARRAHGSISRPKSALQRPPQSSAEAAGALGTAATNDSSRPTEGSHSLELERENRSTITRARSLSNTLSDLFRVRVSGPERQDSGGEEAGPSGS